VKISTELGLSKGSKQNLGSFEENDTVWAVFDQDIHPNFDKAVQLCSANNVNVARSNPCFEIWLILHIEDFQKSDGRLAVQKHLRRLRPEYDPNKGKTADCLKLIEQIEQAEQRAERQLKLRAEERNPFGAPSTTVFQLTLAIREAAKKSRRPKN
jgi:hypothetical protein